MTFAATPSNPHHAQQTMANNTHATPPQHAQVPTTPTTSNAMSPPSKRDLKSWWKGFKLPSKHQEHQESHGEEPLPSTPCAALQKQLLVFHEAEEGDPIHSPGNAILRQFLFVEKGYAAATTAAPNSNYGLSKPTSWGMHDLRSTFVLFLNKNPRAQCSCFSVAKYLNTRLIFAETRAPGIFGVPLRQSIVYANVAISLVDDDGKSYIYGYVPIVVAKCGVFLKEKATSVEGIFRLNGSEKRIKELKQVFDSPDRYGKGLSWDGYTVHDAANVLRRYLNDLPEPVVPLDLYEKFRDPLRGATKSAVGDAEGPQFVDDFDVETAIVQYQQLIKELPPLNKQLLLYILDLLAVFAAKADENRMNSQNLAAIFQPGMLSHPRHAMAPEEYRLNQCVIIFLIENQDHFLIGMQGTAADEKTVQEVQKGTPAIVAPMTPSSGRKSGVHRSASNASAGAESVAKEGKLRRNQSTSSRHSRRSNGAASPASPALPTTPSTSGGLGRSNTVPSKRSPALQSGRFAHMRNETIAAPPVSPLTPVVSLANIPAPPIVQEAETPEPRESDPSAGNTGGLAPAHAAERSQERLLEPKPAPDATTPQKERNLQSLFQRSPTESSDKKPPNKLRKKPHQVASANPSAASSTASLSHSTAALSSNLDPTDPLEKIGEFLGTASDVTSPEMRQSTSDTPSEPTPRASQIPSTGSLHPQSPERNLHQKKSPPTSLHSALDEGSEMDHVDEALISSVEQPDQPEQHEQQERKRKWRLSRRKDETATWSEPTVTSPRKVLGFNRTADMSTTSVGTDTYRPRPSFTGEPRDPTLASSENLQASFDSGGRDVKEDKGIAGWIKNKMREAKETAGSRAKSPPASGDRTSLNASLMPIRGKSLDIQQQIDEVKEAGSSHPQQEPRP